MSKFLIVYGSTEGHTALIAQRMAAVLRASGHEVTLEDSREAQSGRITTAFDGILVGGSVHAGEHQSSLREFVKRNLTALRSTRAAFFSVSLSAANPDEESVGETNAMVQKFVRETGWEPMRIQPMAGALVYTQYNFFIRQLMRLIAKNGGRDELDTSRDYDFTDWEAVEAFAQDFAASVNRPLASLP
jgi:menaquinone-dependent protoporphyrinogen oxidase